MDDGGAGDPRHQASPQPTGGGGGQPPRSPTPLDLSAAAYRRLSPSLRPPAHPQVRLPSPYPQIPSPAAASGHHHHHSRSLSQPLFFSLDSLPPLPYADLAPPPPAIPPSPPSSTSDNPSIPHGLPPRKGGNHHRRSQSDIPFGFSQLSPPLPPAPPPPPVKREGGRSDGGDDAALYDLVNSYMDLDGMDALNSSDEPHEDRDSRASGNRAGSAAESSENEAESHSNSVERNDGGSKSRHCRSLSVDSFMGKLNFAAGDESPKLPLPSPSGGGGGLSRSGSGSLDGGAAILFGAESANWEFSEAEKKKIMANERLAEIALTDPKRVKRILANRQSAARSKERKMRYIQELEHKVQVLQTEATTLSAQLTMLQRDSSGLATQNNELKIRLQAMEQQAQLRDALNEALTAEVQRLKLATGEISDGRMSKGLQQQMNSQLIQLQQLQIQQQQSSQTTQQGQQQQSQKSA
uniref:BZIP domain-containing protein n=1 Tax=Leersia perrieri TaxID=77586 RepID=A0A0D9XAF3_9ORYZ